MAQYSPSSTNSSTDSSINNTHLKIESVTKPNTPTPINTNDSRKISEVVQMTIKASDLDSLVEKLGKHIAIIQED